MLYSAQNRDQAGSVDWRTAWAALAVVILMMVTTGQARAQSLTVLHTFTGGQDGAHPLTGLTMDQGGDLYGTTELGDFGFGALFELKRTSSGFIFKPLYGFTGGADGSEPQGRLTIGPNGSLYGTTRQGGINCNGNGCGTVFNLQPPARTCQTTACPWLKTTLYAFTTDAGPVAGVTFDPAGNLYGTAPYGGAQFGFVYKLSQARGGWTESVVYNFQGGEDGSNPVGAVLFDRAGNLYSQTRYGGLGAGEVYQLTPAGGNWTKNTIFSFPGGAEGGGPDSDLILDAAGNLYGDTGWLSLSGNPGTVFQLTPSGGNWSYSLLYGFPPGPQGAGYVSSLVMDGAGNLYGTTSAGGVFNADCPDGCGTVFELTPSAGGWLYTDLHDFTGGSDGALPFSNVVLDASGNLYGTTDYGGSGGCGCGVVWEITP